MSQPSRLYVKDQGWSCDILSYCSQCSLDHLWYLTTYSAIIIWSFHWYLPLGYLVVQNESTPWLRLCPAPQSRYSRFSSPRLQLEESQCHLSNPMENCKIFAPKVKRIVQFLYNCDKNAPFFKIVEFIQIANLSIVSHLILFCFCYVFAISEFHWSKSNGEIEYDIFNFIISQKISAEEEQEQFCLWWEPTCWTLRVKCHIPIQREFQLEP